MDLQLSVQSVPITTTVVRSNHVHGELCSIQHYVIKFVSDLWQVCSVLRFSPPIKMLITSCCMHTVLVDQSHVKHKGIYMNNHMIYIYIYIYIYDLQIHSQMSKIWLTSDRSCVKNNIYSWPYTCIYPTLVLFEQSIYIDWTMFCYILSLTII